LANERLDSGILISPAGDSARYYFQQALSSDPENQAAQQGLITIAGKLVLQARSAIDAGQLDNADALLGDAASLDPNSSELTAATTVLADAREAVAEAARQAEAERLAEIQRQQEAARKAEAERLAEIQRQEEAARKAEAERLAELARQQEAARLAAIERQAELERQAEAQRQADLRREAEEKQREAERIAARQREAEAAAAALEEAEKNANKAATASPLGVGAAAPVRPRPAQVTASRSQSNQAPVEQRAPVTEKSQPAVSASTGTQKSQPEMLASNGNGATTFRLPDPESTDSAAAQQQAAATTTQNVQRPAPRQLPPVQAGAPSTGSVAANSGPVEPEVVPVGRLTRTNYVGPEYPRAARRRNVTGSVDIMFTVTTDGRVRSLEIVRSEPADTFDAAAMDAVEQWRFEPVIENGVAVEKRTAVRLAFDLQ
jgi:TonB family protein